MSVYVCVYLWVCACVRVRMHVYVCLYGRVLAVI